MVWKSFTRSKTDKTRNPLHADKAKICGKAPSANLKRQFPRNCLSHILLAPAFTTRLDASHLALTLPSSALRLRLRNIRLFAPALIAHAGEEQDLSTAAATRSDAPGTVRR